MPVAGEEGYETLVICPYDRAHEIRLGRMQFHLEKCRKNFPNSPMERCPLNSTHIIPKMEMEYHIQQECSAKSNWERGQYEVGDTQCPVAGLVPVNAGTVPECPESWDDCDIKESVLDIVRQQAEEKMIIRSMQCESKSKRKAFRRAEHERLERLQREGVSSASSTPAPSVVREPIIPTLIGASKTNETLMKKIGNIDKTEVLSLRMKKMGLNSSRPEPTDIDSASETGSIASMSYATAASEVNSVVDWPTSASSSVASYATVKGNETMSASTSVKSSASAPWGNEPTGASNNRMSDASVSTRNEPIIPSTSVMSYASISKGNGAAVARSTTANNAGESRPSSRPSTAMSIAASVSNAAEKERGFSQIPVPGLGRGQRSRRNN